MLLGREGLYKVRKYIHVGIILISLANHREEGRGGGRERERERERRVQLRM